MLGLGLLGAIVSTALHERASTGGAGKTTGQPLVEDLTGVLMRGISAAIIVFLAVEGGLTIFGSSGADPNPYVLLLTCLIAAAFSSDVWDWAHQLLLQRLRIKDVDSVAVTPGTATVAVGQSTPLAASVLDSSGAPLANVPVAWSSSDNTIATVAPTGTVTGVAPGSATITAEAGGIQGTAAITVT